MVATSGIHEHTTWLRLHIAQQYDVGLAFSDRGVDGVPIGRPGNAPGDERGFAAEVGSHANSLLKPCRVEGTRPFRSLTHSLLQSSFISRCNQAHEMPFLRV